MRRAARELDAEGLNWKGLTRRNAGPPGTGARWAGAAAERQSARDVAASSTAKTVAANRRR